MKEARYTNAKRVERREEREQRVKAGRPSAGLDYRCPVCKAWFSTYRNRHGIHRAHCEKQRARQIIARRESDRAQPTPHPSRSGFAVPEPSAPCSPAPVPLTAGGSEQDQQILDDHVQDDVLQQPEDVLHVSSDALDEASVLDEAPAPLAGPDHDSGESYLFSWVCVPYMCSNAESYLVITTLDEEVHLQQNPDGPDIAGPGANEDIVQDPITWPLELGQTLIVYHPHAQRAPQVIPTKELPAFSRNSHLLENPVVNDSQPPYFPFETLADFEQTELFVKRDCADPFINEQLDLWRRYASNNGVTLKNAREMHQCLWAAGIEDDLSQVP